MGRREMKPRGQLVEFAWPAENRSSRHRPFDRLSITEAGSCEWDDIKSEAGAAISESALEWIAFVALFGEPRIEEVGAQLHYSPRKNCLHSCIAQLLLIDTGKQCFVGLTAQRVHREHAIYTHYVTESTPLTPATCDFGHLRCCNRFW